MECDVSLLRWLLILGNTKKMCQALEENCHFATIVYN
jgi:hypothetical protein